MKSHTRTRRTKKPRPHDFGKSAWTIRFETEAQLRERLESLLALFERPRSRRGQFEELAAAESCLSLIQCVEIVSQALAPKPFIPTEKLGETYLTSQERELFKARVVKGVTGARCDIRQADVPAGEGTPHSAVVNAIRKSAHA